MTDRHQVSIFHQNDGVHWRTTKYQGNVGDFTDSNRGLPALIKDACDTIVAKWPCDFYFSTRSAAEVAATKPVEDAALLQGSVPGASIFVMSPEGSRAHDTESWATLWRNPFGGISSAGRASRFKLPPGRTDTLIAVIEDWFAKEGWQSFEPRHHREGAPGHPVIHRPPFHRRARKRPS